MAGDRGEVENPLNGLGRPWCNTVGKIKQERGALGLGDPAAAGLNKTAVGRQNAGNTFKQSGLACAIRTDQSQHLARTHLEAYIIERLKPAEALRETADLETPEIIHSCIL